MRNRYVGRSQTVWGNSAGERGGTVIAEVFARRGRGGAGKFAVKFINNLCRESQQTE